MLHLITSIPQGPSLWSGRVRKKKWKQTRKIIHLLCLEDTHCYLCKTPEIRLMCIRCIRPFCTITAAQSGLGGKGKNQCMSVCIKLAQSFCNLYLTVFVEWFKACRDHQHVLNRCTGCPADAHNHHWPDNPARFIHHTSSSLSASLSLQMSLLLSVHFLSSIRAEKGRTLWY